MPRLRAYIAGPEVFLRNAIELSEQKKAICADLGFDVSVPLNQDIQSSTYANSDELASAIFYKDLAMMQSSDFVIANLTPFGGVSADAGTLVELGYFLGAGKPIFAYSNDSTIFSTRFSRFLASSSQTPVEISIEGFDLTDNLMIPFAVLHAGGVPIVAPTQPDTCLGLDALDMFQLCVKRAVRSPAFARLSAQRLVACGKQP